MHFLSANHGMSGVRTVLMALLVTIVPCSVYAEKSPTASEPVAIDIPAQDLSTALIALSGYYQTNIFGDSAVTRDKRAAAISGSFTVESALKQLLKGTGLEAAESRAGGYVIRETPSVPDDQNSQSAPEDQPIDLGTLVLTGERVERDLFSTASSVEVFDGGSVRDNSQDNNLEAVFANAANVSTFSGNTAPHIRGINSAGAISGGALGTFAGANPRATITVDGRNLSPNETIYGTTSVFDTEAVEVFRGPQTTSQGANAVGGAINLRTRNPIFEFEASGRAEAASRDGRVASLMLNTPVSDSIALRFTYDYEEQDVFFDYVPFGGVELDDVLEDSARYVRQQNGRLKLLWEPEALPQFSTQLTLTYADFDGSQNQGVSAPLDRLETGVGPFGMSSFTGDTLGLVHDIEYEFLNGLVLSNRFQYSESDSTRSALPGPVDDFDQEITDYSNETLLTFAPEGSSFSGVAGIFFRDTQDDGFVTGGVLEGGREGFGVFSEFTYAFQNDLDVTAGLRYQEDEATRFSGFVGLPPIVDFEESYDAFLPKFSIGYQPTENTRYALQLSRGYNPGGVGIILTAPFAPPYQYDDEFVTNLEFSVRHGSEGGRLFLGANVFYNDYEDYQLFVNKLLPMPVPPLFSQQAGRLFNVDDLKTFGLEVTAQYQTTDTLTFTGSLGLLNTDIGDLGPQVAAFTESTADNGNELPFAPSATLRIDGEYQVTDRLSLGARANYTGSYFSDIANDASTEAGDFVIIDLNAAYQLSERTQLYGYVSNVFDELGIIGVGRDGVTGEILGGSVTEPREIGFGIRASF
ncbi:MAG: TonB-dependent receptor [Pseudomonadota bacterium]